MSRRPRPRPRYTKTVDIRSEWAYRWEGFWAGLGTAGLGLVIWLIATNH